MSKLESEEVDACPACNGEVTFVFGLGGASESNDGTGVYYVCLDCDWTGGMTQKVVCFPFGSIAKDSA